MNVKIKADGVFCPFEQIYEQCYTGLYQSMASTQEWIFTERKVGPGYLQWDLPGEDWTQLTTADPIMQLEIKSALHKRKLSIIQLGIVDESLINKILSTPDDSYVYFRKGASGAWDIKLTAWGYSYPVRVKPTSISGIIDPQITKQEITLRMVYDGKPVAGKKFHINGYERYTNDNGELFIEELPVDYGFDVQVDDIVRHVVIKPGETLEEFDLTKHTLIEVSATMNGVPYAGATANVSYNGKQLSLQLDANGRTCSSIVLSPENDICTICIDDASESKPLTVETNTFTFALTKEELPPMVTVDINVLEDGNPCVNKDLEISYDGNKHHLTTDGYGKASIELRQNLENNVCTVECAGKTVSKNLYTPQTGILIEFTSRPVTTNKKILIKATRNTQPYAGANIDVTVSGQAHHLLTDATGQAELQVQVENTAPPCTVTCEDKQVVKQLTDEVTLFAFDFEDMSVAETEVFVTVSEKNQPCQDMVVTLNCNGNKYTLKTDANGQARLRLPITNQDSLCHAQVLDCTLQKKLEAPQTRFEFEIVEREHTPWWTYLLGLLGILLFILLTIITFNFCAGMLFG